MFFVAAVLCRNLCSRTSGGSAVKSEYAMIDCRGLVDSLIQMNLMEKKKE